MLGDAVVLRAARALLGGSDASNLHASDPCIQHSWCSSATGGLADNWFNLKVAFDSATRQAKLYVNNCLIKTVSGPGGDGRFYLKNGVYHCGASGGCKTHFKNVHLYTM